MLRQLKNRNFYVVLLLDLICFVASLSMAYEFRFEFVLPGASRHELFAILPWVLAIKCAVFFLLGSYQGLWRYTSFDDAVRIFKGSAVSTLIIIAGLTYINRFHGYPRSVFLADCVFTFFLCGGLRAGIRFYYSTLRHRKHQAEEDKSAAATPRHRTRLLVVGAGDAADKILRDIQGDQASRYQVMCCVDDDPSIIGRTLHGVAICGPIQGLPAIALRYEVAEVLIAIPSLDGDKMRQIVALCEQAGLRCRTLPPITAIIDGRVSVNDIREVNFEDLLGRPAVRMNMATIGQYLTGKTVIVTGGGGSIGAELCRQIIRFQPAKLVVVEACELNLYMIEMELRQERKFNNVVPVMARVQHRPLMARVFHDYQPQVVFHAAACKHVPMLEANPWEAVFNNVLGSQVVMDLAADAGVERFVLVSTDKAVRPASVMGASKRMAEILLQSRPNGPTRFMAVRFGNVVGSSGSVIPLFQRQIKAGGPVTVTDQGMIRYFMTIPEACQLILQAGGMGAGGELFILEMGTPVNIYAMARDLIRLSGKAPDRDIEIVYTGLRPGEKLYEELMTQDEGVVPTPHERIMVLRRNGSHGADAAPSGLAALVDAARHHDGDLIKQTLKSLIPEYCPSTAGCILRPREEDTPAGAMDIVAVEGVPIDLVSDRHRPVEA